MSSAPSPPQFPGFQPRPGLRGGHLQTLAAQFLRRRIHLPPPEDLHVQVAEGVQVLCHCHWQPDRRHAPALVIVHGLEGSSQSQYVIGATAKALAAGMSVVRMNMRNCGRTGHLGPTLYHSGLSGDVREIALAVLRDQKVARLLLLGFSLGGNLVLKLAGEWGREAPAELRGVAAVSPALDLAASADALHLPANRLYELYFLWNLKRSVRAKARLYQGRYDLTRLRRLRSLRDFDHRVTAFYCGFESADDYYARASAAQLLDRLAVPVLVIHAADDPFIRITPSTRAKLLGNACIRYVETEHGGHCGFLGRAADGDDGRWAERAAVDFLRRC
jgi:uncharacterized protein